jgi:hypothetical protein
MDILAGRKSVGELKGMVLVNKARQHRESFRKRTAYVPQVRRALFLAFRVQSQAHRATIATAAPFPCKLTFTALAARHCFFQPNPVPLPPYHNAPPKHSH